MGSILTITASIATSLVITMSSLEVYMRESREMGNRLGMFSAEYQKFRDWWALNMDKASGPRSRGWLLTSGDSQGEAAAADWSEMCHLSSDWLMSFVHSSQAVTMSCLKSIFLVKFNFYFVDNIITLLKLTQ